MARSIINAIIIEMNFEHQPASNKTNGFKFQSYSRIGNRKQTNVAQQCQITDSIINLYPFTWMTVDISLFEDY